MLRIEERNSNTMVVTDFSTLLSRLDYKKPTEFQQRIVLEDAVTPCTWQTCRAPQAAAAEHTGLLNANGALWRGHTLGYKTSLK